MLLLWAYLRAHPTQLAWVFSPPSNATPTIVGLSAVGFLVSWVIGSFLNAVRDLLECLIDRRYGPLNWDFFFKAERQKVEQLMDYYYCYYCLDFTSLLAIVLFLISEITIIIAHCKFLSRLPLTANIVLVIAAVVLVLSARSIRRDIKRLVGESMSVNPHESVYVRLQPSHVDEDGVGVFAIRDIPKGTIIFRNDDSEMVWVDEGAIGELDPEIKRLYGDFCVLKNGRYGCPKNFNMLTVGWYINESKDNPNVRCTPEYDFAALREIKKGEELLVDYRTYSESPAYPDRR
jgi:hypothetical protein